MSNLRQILKEAINATDKITFARFMELALYCPNFGYYEQNDMSPGRKGDFYTSVSVGPLFGELLARQFATWLSAVNDSTCEKPTNKNSYMQILEAGAHNGQLAADILGCMQKERPELFRSVEYWILEPSARRRERQQKMLAAFSEHIRWFESWEALPQTGVNGVIFSNELLDAMPVHRLGWDAEKKLWFEWGVAISGDEFVWTKMFDTDAAHFTFHTPHSALESVLPDGFTTEICPAAVDWWRNAARALKSGKLLTFDYGVTAEQFFTPERRDGTLRAYRHHHQTTDLLAHPGEQDITAHVNFTAIQSTGEEEGLRTESFSSQAQFLVGIVERESGHDGSLKKWSPAHIRQFQTLTHPEHLGHLFRVLAQSR